MNNFSQRSKISAMVLGFFATAVNAGDLELRLHDKGSGQVLTQQEVTAFQSAHDGTLTYSASGVTDEAGIVHFDLDNIENGQAYVFKTVAYQQTYAVSPEVSEVDHYTWELGNVTLQVLDGRNWPFLPIANNPVQIRVLTNGNSRWFANGETDASGEIKLTLPDISNGIQYPIRSRNPSTGSWSIGPTISDEAPLNFIVGDYEKASVNIIKADGLALENTEVILYELNDDSSTTYIEQSTTNDQGYAEFAFSDFDANKTYFFRSSLGHEFIAFSPSIELPSHFTWNIENVTVSLIDNTIRPQQALANTAVRIERLENGQYRWYGNDTTDAQGKLQLTLPNLDQATYRVRVTHPTTNKTYFSENIDAAESYEWSVGHPSAAITVVNALAQTFMPDLRVAAYRFGEYGELNFLHNITTNAEGVAHVELPDIDAGASYRLAVSPFGGSLFYSDVIDSYQDYTFAIGDLSVTLKHSETGEAIADKIVSLQEIDGNGNGTVAFYGRTDDLGQLIFGWGDNPMDGNYQLWTRDPFGNDERFSLPIDLNSTNHVDFVIAPSQSDIPDANIEAAIKASRNYCASPCTVVFSAEDTVDGEKTQSEVWRELSYHWDFDTDESSTYGHLYDQTYTYVEGDTAYEAGHVPLVTKTFLCETGTCEYRVGLRAQNQYGQYDDAFTTITVNAESTQWQASNTLCVSNSLSLDDNWEQFDKGCPAGANKSNALPNADDYGDKLILIKNGDTFNQNIAPMMSESNWKIGTFGNAADTRPYINGKIILGASLITLGDSNAPERWWTFANEEDVDTMGWPENITLEGIKTQSVEFPMSYQHLGLHDVNLNQQGQTAGGYINLARGVTYCHDFPGALPCNKVPFSKGGYLSKVEIVGGDDALQQRAMPLNIEAMQCAMVNYNGIVDSYIRRSGEHNLRIMGWYRFSVMRNVFGGEHASNGKAKLTPRMCASGWVDGVRFADNQNPDLWRAWSRESFFQDIEGRTRADADKGDGANAWSSGAYVHQSRFQVVNGNQLGLADVKGSGNEGPKYNNNLVVDGDGREYLNEELLKDVIITNNRFSHELGSSSGIDIRAPSENMTCVFNQYSSGHTSCTPTETEDNKKWNMSIEPPLTPVPEAPVREE